MLLIIFILVAGHWEFSNIEHVNGIVDMHEYCSQLAGEANNNQTRAFCIEDTGVEA